MQNTIMFLSVAEQLNDPRTTNIHNVARTIVEETHFPIPHPQSTSCTPSLVHQTFGYTRESFNVTNLEWMTNLFGIDLNTSNSVALYLVSL